MSAAGAVLSTLVAMAVIGLVFAIIIGEHERQRVERLTERRAAGRRSPATHVRLIEKGDTDA